MGKRRLKTFALYSALFGLCIPIHLLTMENTPPKKLSIDPSICSDSSQNSDESTSPIHGGLPLSESDQEDENESTSSKEKLKHAFYYHLASEEPFDINTLSEDNIHPFVALCVTNILLQKECLSLARIFYEWAYSNDLLASKIRTALDIFSTTGFAHLLKKIINDHLYEAIITGDNHAATYAHRLGANTHAVAIKLIVKTQNNHANPPPILDYFNRLLFLCPATRPQTYLQLITSYQKKLPMRHLTTICNLLLAHLPAQLLPDIQAHSYASPINELIKTYGTLGTIKSKKKFRRWFDLSNAGKVCALLFYGNNWQIDEAAACLVKYFESKEAIITTAQAFALLCDQALQKTTYTNFFHLLTRAAKAGVATLEKKKKSYFIALEDLQLDQKNINFLDYQTWSIRGAFGSWRTQKNLYKILNKDPKKYGTKKHMPQTHKTLDAFTDITIIFDKDIPRLKACSLC